MRSSGRKSWPFTPLAALAVFAFLIVMAGGASRLRPNAAPLFGMRGAEEEVPRDCVGEDSCLMPPSAPPSGPSDPVLRASEACVGGGYLCAELDGPEPFRILRWPDTLSVITVRVPIPDFEPPARARALQSAAVRGLQAWQGRPFPIRIIDRRRSESAEIRVRWSHQLGGTSLGHTRSQWREQDGEKSLKIMDFALATRSPYNPRYELSPHEVELVAAHEMGHVLGLPHSDSPRDVMYPSNTARSLSARDYRTLEALYSLPNGALIQR